MSAEDMGRDMEWLDAMDKCRIEREARLDAMMRELGLDVTVCYCQGCGANKPEDGTVCLPHCPVQLYPAEAA